MNKKKKVYLVIIILIIAFIWLQSCLPKPLSTEVSNSVAVRVHQPDPQFRKVAHVIEFAVLGLFLMLYDGRIKRCYYPLLAGFIVSFLDETIQMFSGRGPEIADVWRDLLGIGIGIAIGMAVMESRRAGVRSR